MPRLTTASHRTKILVLGSGIYARPFTKYGEIKLADWRRQEYGRIDISDVKLVVFTGGDDVHPSMYAHPIHTMTSHVNLQRDKQEATMFTRCTTHGIPMVGICRGAQFLTVMNGGSLIQHVDNHAIDGTHHMITSDGELIHVTSTHHQMMNPLTNGEVIAWSQGLATEYQWGSGASASPKRDNNDVPMEPEVVWFDNTQSLAVQYHPEYMADNTSGYLYFQDLLKHVVKL